jgi:hypothetical protein
MLCFKPNQIRALIQAVDTTNLDPVQKKNLQSRMSFVLHNYRLRACRYSFAYHFLRVSITIGSLIVPALLSIQPNGTTTTNLELSATLYWIVWCLSLCVTISNGFISLFKVDKKYFTLNTTYQLLLSEGWQFIELSGKFNGQHYPGSDVTHKGQYPFYTHSIEKIRMKQIEDEYYKAPEQQGSGVHESLVPQTPSTFANTRLARQDSQQLVNGRSAAPRTASDAPPAQGSGPQTRTVLQRIPETTEV